MTSLRLIRESGLGAFEPMREGHNTSAWATLPQSLVEARGRALAMFEWLTSLGGHPKPATNGHLKTGHHG